MGIIYSILGVLHFTNTQFYRPLMPKFLPAHDFLIYLSGIAEIVLGNSSSGIVESPSLGIKSINIGHRQDGRERASSTIDVSCSAEMIIKTVRKCVKKNQKDNERYIENPYDPFLDGQNSFRVASTCIDALKNFTKDQLLNKKFCKSLKKKQWNSISSKENDF